MPRLTVSRRRFLQTTTGAGAVAAIGFPTIIPSRAFGANAKLNVAGIGCGGKGAVDTDGVSSENVVALCDVDEGNLLAAAQRFPNARRYRDFREMLDKEQKNIDAVTVSTPDHTHAPAAAKALRMGKHVYCQKPLTHTVYEARLLTTLARQGTLATQMGNQGHSDAGLRRNAELIRAGVLGDVTEAHVWTDRPIWPQGISARPPEEDVPGNVDWDLWLGPAPERPYSSAYHPFKWRGFWDFGTGALGDMACHCMDVVFTALDLPAPASVSAEHEGNTQESAPKWSVIDYRFPANGKQPAFKMVWYDGKRKPSADLVKGRELASNGVIIVGSKDTMYVPSYWGAGTLVSGTNLEEFKDVPQSLGRRPEGFDRGHYMEWIEACKGGPAAQSNFDFAGPMTEAVLLGNVAIRAGERIEWDSKNLRVTNSDAANKLISKAYRKGWEIETPRA